MKKTEADKDMIQKLYEESTIASKVMQAIIKKANVTVTDDEAKTVKVYKLVFTTKTTDSKTGKEKDMTAAEKKDQLKKAKSALKMIKKGQSISSVAKKFSVNSDNEESYTKGKAALGTKFETAAAKLKKNQVSGVVRRCIRDHQDVKSKRHNSSCIKQIHTASGKTAGSIRESLQEVDKRCRQEVG